MGKGRERKSGNRRGRERKKKEENRKEGKVERKVGKEKRQGLSLQEHAPPHAHTHIGMRSCLLVLLFAGIPCPWQMPTDFLNDDSVYQ